MKLDPFQYQGSTEFNLHHPTSSTTDGTFALFPAPLGAGGAPFHDLHLAQRTFEKRNNPGSMSGSSPRPRRPSLPASPWSRRWARAPRSSETSLPRPRRPCTPSRSPCFGVSDQLLMTPKKNSNWRGVQLRGPKYPHLSISVALQARRGARREAAPCPAMPPARRLWPEAPRRSRFKFFSPFRGPFLPKRSLSHSPGFSRPSFPLPC